MSYSAVETSLRGIAKNLDLVSARRERLIKESRDIISLSAKTIVRLHASEIGEARKLSSEAKRKLKELRKIASHDLVRYIFMPEQEYVESMAMLAIKTGKRIPAIAMLGVAPSSYVLGLLDTVGELKRALYDDIRRDDLAGAEEKFAAMESLHTLLSPFALYDNIVQGVRRKLDISRILIEDARAAITEESRRSEFMEVVTNLSLKLGTATMPSSSERNAKIRKNNEIATRTYQDQETGESEEVLSTGEAEGRAQSLA